MSGPLLVTLGVGWAAMFVAVCICLSREARKPIEPPVRTDAELLNELLKVRHELMFKRVNGGPATPAEWARYNELRMREVFLTRLTGVDA